MPSPQPFRKVRQQLENDGWRLARVRGSHHIFTKPGHRSLPIPVHGGKVDPIYVRKVNRLTGS